MKKYSSNHNRVTLASLLLHDTTGLYALKDYSKKVLLVTKDSETQVLGKRDNLVSTYELFAHNLEFRRGSAQIIFKDCTADTHLTLNIFKELLSKYNFTITLTERDIIVSL